MFESAADRLAFLRDAGEDITIDGAALRAVFTAAYQPIDLFGATVQSQSPEIALRDEDVPESLAVGVSIVSVRGVDYRPAEIQPDGTGMTVVRLQR